mgnify:CR=1 FL=1
MKPCRYCGAKDEPCYAGCECAKCMDPDGYEWWKRNCPWEYQEWLEEQKEEDYY